MPMTRVETMDAALADSMSTERLMTWLLFAFAGRGAGDGGRRTLRRDRVHGGAAYAGDRRARGARRRPARGRPSRRRRRLRLTGPG